MLAFFLLARANASNHATVSLLVRLMQWNVYIVDGFVMLDPMEAALHSFLINYAGNKTCNLPANMLERTKECEQEVQSRRTLQL